VLNQKVGGRPPKKFGHRYPWAEWFKKKRFKLVKGKDFDGMTHGMAAMVRNAACRLRLSVNVSLKENGVVFVVVNGRMEGA
jgi:hypothetical protein